VSSNGISGISIDGSVAPKPASGIDAGKNAQPACGMSNPAPESSAFIGNQLSEKHKGLT
jgi:hypothetical protein